MLIISIVEDSIAASSKCTTKSGSDGNCKPIIDCLNLLNDSDGDFADLTPCTSSDVGIIGEFCCPLTRSNISSRDSYLSESCRKLVQLKEQLNPKLIDFGMNSMPSSVGVKVGELPFMAQIIESDESKYLGAGALISEKFVLTSAHIVFGLQKLPTVRLGKVRL